MLALSVFLGCTKNTTARIDSLPFPSATDYATSSVGKFVSRLKSLPVLQRRPAVRLFFDVHPNWPLIEFDTVASFVWFGKAQVVAINGDLQSGWSRPDTMEVIPCDTDTLFIRTYSLPRDARLDYLFMVNGKESLDPRNPRLTPSGYGPHSEVAMPGFVWNPIRQSRRNVPHGTLDSLMFSSSNDSLTPRRLVVYKPAGYEHLSLLPSLYVHDGIEAINYAAYPTVLDNLIYEKRIEPVLVVFIPVAETDGRFLFEEHRTYANIICRELVPLIDKTFKTDSRPERRAMAGISAGGQFSLIAALDRPDVFLSAAGQSSTIKAEHFTVLDDVVKTGAPYRALRLYFDVGRYDLMTGGIEGLTFLQTNRKFHQQMEKQGLYHLYHEHSGGHQWADWREKTDDILVFFFGHIGKDSISM